MKYEFYLDIYLMTNFLMDMTALMLAAFFLGKRLRIIRLLLAGGLGSVGSLMLMLSMNSYSTYSLMVHLLVNPLMLLVCFGWYGFWWFAKEWLAVYLTMMLLGGIMEWIYGNVLHSTGFLFGYLFTCILGTIAYGGLVVRRKTKGVLFAATIRDRNWEIKVQAFYDTGNLLMDPYTKQPVSLITKSLYQKNCGEQLMTRMIPFHALGSEEGLIEAVTVEELRIMDGTDDKEKIRIIRPAVIALAEDSLFAHQNYQMILHSSLLHNHI